MGIWGLVEFQSTFITNDFNFDVCFTVFDIWIFVSVSMNTECLFQERFLIPHLPTFANFAPLTFLVLYGFLFKDPVSWTDNFYFIVGGLEFNEWIVIKIVMNFPWLINKFFYPLPLRLYRTPFTTVPLEVLCCFLGNYAMFWTNIPNSLSTSRVDKTWIVKLTTVNCTCFLNPLFCRVWKGACQNGKDPYWIISSDPDLTSVDRVSRQVRGVSDSFLILEFCQVFLHW